MCIYLDAIMTPNSDGDCFPLLSGRLSVQRRHLRLRSHIKSLSNHQLSTILLPLSLSLSLSLSFSLSLFRSFALSLFLNLSLSTNLPAPVLYRYADHQAGVLPSSLLVRAPRLINNSAFCLSGCQILLFHRLTITTSSS